MAPRSSTYRAEAPDPVKRIHVNPPDEESRHLWKTIALLARELDDVDGWCLVGGLMVQLFSYEHEQLARPTTDVDILADARRRPSVTRVVAERLQSLGARAPAPTGLHHELGYGFELDGELVEVLAPDGIKHPPRTLGKLGTIRVPGGTQALAGSEVVEVVVDGEAPVRLRRPTLLAALLLKVRAVPVHERPDDQLRDVIQLLGLLPDPRAARKQLRGAQRTWLKKLAKSLKFDEPRWRSYFSTTHLRRAEQAFKLMTADT